MATRPAARGSRATINALLFLVLILFFAVVSYGWLRLLLPVMSRGLAISLAALVTLIAVLVAQLIGKEKAARDSGGGDSVLLTWLTLYPFLFLISALGTINFFFYGFEGRSVLLQNIDDAQAALTQLQNAARQRLRDSAHEEKVADVERLLSSLRQEIVNPNGRNSCGVGAGAREIIRDIRVILPQFRELTGSENQHACNSREAPAVYEAYRTQAQRMLEQDTAYVRSGGPEHRTLQYRLEQQTGTARAALDAAETRLAAGNEAGFGGDYAGAQRALEGAATAYAENRERLEAASGAPVEPGFIDISSSRQLGSIMTIPQTLARRIFYPTTWVYLIFALALDFALLLLFAKANAGARVSSWSATSSSGRRSDPQFLWVNSAQA